MLEKLEDRTLLSINPIVAENQLAGTPQSVWDIPSQDAGDLTIQGFATAMSVNHGQTISFKIDDTQKAAYHLAIYRMGYYQGNGARLITTISSSQTQDVAQPSPLTNSATGLIDCGNWSVTASWAVPSAAVSGIYFADVIRNDTGGMSQIFFVVRDDNDASPSDILFKTADSTWVAYNDYGGNSLYTGSPRNYGPYPGAYAVSYNRPFNTRSDQSQSFVYNAEYPMARWLEANGYNVSYTTDVDTAQSNTQLLQHKVFMAVGHDEYWSAAERNNVAAARAAGVNLTFFSGNEVFWETRWAASTDSSATPYRTLVCYKETFQPGVDPQDPPQWTGTFRDPRQPGGAQPENALTGTLFMVNGGGPADIRDDAITIPSSYAKLRFWRNTAIAALQSGQSYSTPTGILGYEWDVMPNNGFEPAGAFALSSTTLDVSGYYLLDYGTTFGAGTATHSLVLYRDPTSHALVFGAGTAQWAWALDGNHDRSGLSSTDGTDINLQQATVNLLADMRSQPGSLESGLVAATASTNTTAPTSTITSPSAGTVLSAGSSITITGTATASGGGVVAGMQVSVDGGSTWIPATMSAPSGTVSWSFTWTPASGGSVTIKTRAVDDSGNLETPSAGTTVTVLSRGDTLWSASATPAIASVGDLSSVEVGVQFTSDMAGNVLGVRFYKGTLNTGTHVGHLWTASGQLLASVTFSGETPTGWQQANFSSPVAIQANTVYVVSYSAVNGHYAQDQGYFGAGGVNSPPLHAPYSLAIAGGNGVYSSSGSFPNQTYNGSNYWVDVVFDGPPTVSAVRPAAGSGNVSTTSPVTISFSKPINASTLTAQTVFLKDPSGNVVPASLSYNATIWTATLTPSSPLGAAVTYTFTVVGGSGGITDTSGNAMAASYTELFTTAGPAAVVTSVTPPAGASGVGTTTSLAVAFSHAMNAATVTAATFQLKDATGNAVPLVVSYNSATFSATLAPTSYLSTSATYTATVLGGSGGVQDINGQPLASSYSWTFTTAATASPAPSLWQPGATPAVASASDAGAVEVGVNFTSDAAGYVTGVRFYKGALNTGTHVGHLWTASGQLLASVTFSNETASGWQQANFASPVPISANTVYVVSYAAPTGHYADDQNYFATAGVNSSPLHAPATNAVANGNGVYAYGPSGTFPSRTYNAANYWVDVVFSALPVVVSVNPASGALNVSPTAPITVSFNKPINASTLTSQTVSLQDLSGNVVPASVSYNAATYAATLTPISALGAAVSYTLTVVGGTNGVVDSSGNAMAASYTESFTTAGPAPVVASVSPAGGATGVGTSTSLAVTFSHAMNAATLTASTFQLKDAFGNAVPLTVSYNSNTFTATLGLALNLSTSVTYTATVVGSSAGVLDVNGQPLASSYSWSFTTAAVASPASSLWLPGATPTVASANDLSAVEVGLKFTSDVAGYVSGVRFYKGPGNTGTHVGHLWTASGQQLASVTFSNETASGWQQASFASPVAISANTVYVVSYLAPGGHYADDQNYFAATAVNASPLHAPATAAVAGGNGVYLYTSSGGFPTLSYNGSNYWVDVVFNALPAVISVSPAAGSGNVSTTGSVLMSFNKPMNASTLTSQTVFLQDPSGNVVPATLSYSAANYTLMLTPNSALTADVTYTLTVVGGSAGVLDTSGNAMTASYTESFTTTGPAPVVTSVSPAAGTTGVSTLAAITVTFSHAMNAATLTASTIQLKDASGNAIPLTVSYNSTTFTATLTPSAFLSTLTTYTVTVVGGSGGVQDVNGQPLASSYSWSFTTAATASFYPSLWLPAATPTVASANDASAVEVGVKFTSAVAGSVTGVRFYKGSLNTGTHVGHLWTASGQQLASVTFSNETASGWQQASFASPVAISANTVYVVSYLAPGGHYADDQNYFATTGVNASPLHAPATAAVAGGNGVYLYTSSGGFPTQSYNGSNYWVDVVFSDSPSITSVSPAAASTGVSRSAPISITFDRAMSPTTLSSSTIMLKDPSGNIVSAAVTYNSTTNTVTLTPSAPLNAFTTYTLVILGGTTGVEDMFGNYLAANFTLSFTTGS